ncbi:MAG TPA: hypothetical protein VG268_15515 [Streptosporangiaceae bacterium]|jgi:hypothetical protein|nr:hypothetical protein [Streptosporangiaceae bacterium]
MRPTRVIWRSSAELSLFAPLQRRPGSFRRALRAGALLVTIAVTQVAGRPRWRFAAIGVALIIPGVLLRSSGPASSILLPGLMSLFYAPFLPGESHENRVRQARLRRELAAYSSPADRRDLEALLAQYPDGETGELRAILADQAVVTPAPPGIPGLTRY